MTINDSHRDLSIVSHATSGGESESVLTILVHTTKVFSALVAECVITQGFTLDEWMVLDAIERHHGSSMSRISAASGCSGASLTRTVDKLVTNALVYREASQTDRRKVEVFISNRGRDVHRDIQEHLYSLERSVEELIKNSGIDRSSLVGLVKDLQHVHLNLAVGAQ